MEKEIKDLILKLKKENEERSTKINSGTCSEYGHTVLVHTYNNTIEIINQLESIVNH